MRASTLSLPPPSMFDSPAKNTRMPRNNPAGSAYSKLAKPYGHVAEDALRQPDAGSLELFGELRPDPRWPQTALDLPVDVRGLLEHEDVLEHDRVALHSLDLGDVRDLARAVLEPRDLDDEEIGRASCRERV